MDAQFGRKQQDFGAVWVTNSGSTVGANVTLNNISPEQIGIFIADDLTPGHYKATATPSFQKNSKFFLAQGIQDFEGQNFPYSTRQPKFPRKSMEFSKSDIVAWGGEKAKRGASTQVVAIGYDGINANKSINKKLDAKPIIIRIILEGEPIRKFFNAKDGRIIREYAIDKGLCASDCECVDTCGKVPAQNIADGLIEAIKADKFNGQAISTFVRASKIMKCDPGATEPTPTSTYKKYVLTVKDDGNSTIGLLGAAGDVYVEKREGIETTYAVWRKSTAGAPANVTVTGSVIPNCGICPSGYTSVPQAHIYDIKVPVGTSIPALPGQISVTKMGTDGLVDGYVALLNLTWDHDASGGTPNVPVDLDDVNDILNPIASTYTYLGLREQICTSNTSQTLTWVDSLITKVTITKDYGITLGDTVCGTSRLTELQAAYPELTITQDAASGTCAHVYKTTIESELVDPLDCGRWESYTFNEPAEFDGVRWYDWAAVVTTPSCTDPAAPSVPCCAAGVVLEAAVFNSYYKDCTFGWYEWHPNDVLPVKIQVTAHSHDYSNNPCDESEDFVTVLRQPSINRGTSGVVVQEYERSFLGYENKYWVPNPYANEIGGFKVTAIPHLLYDHYWFTIKRVGYDTHYGLDKQNLTTYHFYVKENGGKNIETLINRLIESAGRDDLKAVVL